MRAFLLLVAGALVLAAPAAAGGWATAGLAPPPDGTMPGDAWRAVVTIKQHGVTPLDGVTPSVVIRKGQETRRFAAAPTGTPGVYAATVTFPSGGEWTYAVYDGFSAYGQGKLHTFAPVQIGSPAAGGGGLSLPAWAWGTAAAALVLAAFFLLARRIRPVPSSLPQP